MTPGFKPFGGVSLLVVVILVVTHPVNVAGNGHVDSTGTQSLHRITHVNAFQLLMPYAAFSVSQLDLDSQTFHLH